MADKAREKEPRLCREQGIDVTALWQQLRAEAEAIIAREPHLRSLVEAVILSQEGLGSSIGVRLARKLAREDMNRTELAPLLAYLFCAHPRLVQSAAADLTAIVNRDPACESACQALLFYKGFAAICTYRVSHELWVTDRRDLALYFQSIASEVFGVDIHPAARIGCGILLDHGTSFVAGETAIIEDNVSIFHEVTLGGTGKVVGNRHPIVRSGVLIGAGAKLLGDVEIGECAKVGAGSVVLADVPAHTTVAGVPAIVVGESAQENPALDMDQSLECSDL